MTKAKYESKIADGLIPLPSLQTALAKPPPAVAAANPDQGTYVMTKAKYESKVADGLILLPSQRPTVAAAATHSDQETYVMTKAKYKSKVADGLIPLPFQPVAITATLPAVAAAGASSDQGTYVMTKAKYESKVADGLIPLPSQQAEEMTTTQFAKDQSAESDVAANDRLKREIEAEEQELLFQDEEFARQLQEIIDAEESLLAVAASPNATTQSKYEHKVAASATAPASPPAAATTKSGHLVAGDDDKKKGAAIEKCEVAAAPAAGSVPAVAQGMNQQSYERKVKASQEASAVDAKKRNAEAQKEDGSAGRIVAASAATSVASPSSSSEVAVGSATTQDEMAGTPEQNNTVNVQVPPSGALVFSNPSYVATNEPTPPPVQQPDLVYATDAQIVAPTKQPKGKKLFVSIAIFCLVVTTVVLGVILFNNGSPKNVENRAATLPSSVPTLLPSVMPKTASTPSPTSATTHLTAFPPTTSTQSKQAAPIFYEVQSGTCKTNGYQNIYEHFKCVEAMISLGYNQEWKPYEGPIMTNVVDGCSLMEEQYLFLESSGSCQVEPLVKTKHWWTAMKDLLVAPGDKISKESASCKCSDFHPCLCQ